LHSQIHTLVHVAIIDFIQDRHQEEMDLERSLGNLAKRVDGFDLALTHLNRHESLEGQAINFTTRQTDITTSMKYHKFMFVSLIIHIPM
jgi:hypothetical protein